MKKDTIKKVILAALHDIAISVFAGLVLAIAIGLVVALIAGITSNFELNTIMNAVRSSLLIVGALLLFIVAGVMIGQKSNVKIRSSEKWKSVFKVLGPSIVLFMFSASVLTIATIVDYVVWLS